MSKLSTPELESRLRTTLRDLQTADLTDAVSSRRSEGSRGPGRNAARFAAVALVAVALFGSVAAWRSQRHEPARVQFLAGSQTFDLLLMTDSMRGPFEHELGSAFGSPRLALYNATRSAESGCTTATSNLVGNYLDTTWRTMTVRDYVEAHGTGQLEPLPKRRCGLPIRPVPPAFRTLGTRIGDWYAANLPKSNCFEKLSPATDAIAQPVNDNEIAIQAGASFPGKEKLRLDDQNIAFESHRCLAEELKKLQPAIDKFLSDPENRRLITEAAAFIRDIGLSVD
jgi:hypothetical protein